MAKNPLLQRLGIEHPILLSPMAGAGGTPELAAAVSEAGRAWRLGRRLCQAGRHRGDHPADAHADAPSLQHQSVRRRLCE